MNADPSVNVVVFEVKLAGQSQKLVGEGPTRSPDCVRLVWRTLQEQSGARAGDVRQIYSEWQPAPEDQAFIAASFPSAALSYSFARPAADDWERAMQDVARTIEESVQGQFASKQSRKSWWQFWK